VSKEQLLLLKKIKEICPQRRRQIIENYRPDTLKNPTTNKNLEIDIYLKQLDIGIEYQGGVHFKYIRKYKNDVDKIKLYDILKTDMTMLDKALCIVEVFPQDLVGDFCSNFINRLNNTQEFYFLNCKLKQVRRIEKFKMLIHNANKIPYKLGYYKKITSIMTVLEILSSKRDVEKRLRNFFNIHFIGKDIGFLSNEIFEKFIKKYTNGGVFGYGT